jgi:ribosome-binding protein aMBF1 (putative translation factor)
MIRKAKTSDAVTILHRRYIKDDPERIASLQQERINARVAALIYSARTTAGMSQVELAKLVGTTQSVISRLEDADYDNHSLTMLSRIASALNQELSVAMTARDLAAGEQRTFGRADVTRRRQAK